MASSLPRELLRVLSCRRFRRACLSAWILQPGAPSLRAIWRQKLSPEDQYSQLQPLFGCIFLPVFYFRFLLPYIYLKLPADYFHQSASSSGDCAFDKHQIVFLIHKHNLPILLRNTIRAHSSRHTHAFRHVRAESSPDATRLTLGMFLSVCSRASGKTVPFDHALETLTFGHA